MPRSILKIDRGMTRPLSPRGISLAAAAAALPRWRPPLLLFGDRWFHAAWNEPHPAG
jgi:hypothetical protein